MKARVSTAALALAVATAPLASAAERSRSNGIPSIPVVVTNTPTVKLDPSANTVRTAEPVTVYAADSVGPIAGGGNCSPAEVSLPIGVPVVLRVANVAFFGTTPADNPSAELRVLVKTDEGGVIEMKLAIPATTRDTRGNASGTLLLDGIVLKENGYPDAAVGEAYHASFCLNRGTADSTGSGAEVTLAGTRHP